MREAQRYLLVVVRVLAKLFESVKATSYSHLGHGCVDADYVTYNDYTVSSLFNEYGKYTGTSGSLCSNFTDDNSDSSDLDSS
nr:hypothetical protein HmN_000905100 [Hymenolepis microstoma]